MRSLSLALASAVKVTGRIIRANTGRNSLMKPGFQTSIRCNQTVKIRFYEEGSDSLVEVDAPVGKRVLDIALENNIDIEGACGGELACSTCHVVVSPELYEKLPPKKEEEQDMLDLAWGVTDTSRLCCQILVTPELANAEFRVPSETNNMFKK